MAAAQQQQTSTSLTFNTLIWSAVENVINKEKYGTNIYFMKWTTLFLRLFFLRSPPPLNIVLCVALIGPRGGVSVWLSELEASYLNINVKKRIRTNQHSRQHTCYVSRNICWMHWMEMIWKRNKTTEWNQQIQSKTKHNIECIPTERKSSACFHLNTKEKKKPKTHKHSHAVSLPL